MFSVYYYYLKTISTNQILWHTYSENVSKDGIFRSECGFWQFSFFTIQISGDSIFLTFKWIKEEKMDHEMMNMVKQTDKYIFIFRSTFLQIEMFSESRIHITHIANRKSKLNLQIPYHIIEFCFANRNDVICIMRNVRRKLKEWRLRRIHRAKRKVTHVCARFCPHTITTPIYFLRQICVHR